MKMDNKFVDLHTPDSRKLSGAYYKLYKSDIGSECKYVMDLFNNKDEKITAIFTSEEIMRLYFKIQREILE